MGSYKLRLLRRSSHGFGDATCHERRESRVIALARRLALEAVFEGIKPIEKERHRGDRLGAARGREIMEHKGLLFRVLAPERGACALKPRRLPSLELGDDGGRLVCDDRGSILRAVARHREEEFPSLFMIRLRVAGAFHRRADDRQRTEGARRNVSARLGASSSV